MERLQAAVASRSARAARCGERGSIMGTVVALLLVTIVLGLAALSCVDSMLSYQRTTSGSARASMAAYAAVNHAFSELALMEETPPTDDTQHGFGALGVTAPVVLRDSDGRPIAEYKAILRKVDDDYVIMSVAAVPSFSAQSRSLAAIEALIGTRTVTTYPIGDSAAMNFSGNFSEIRELIFGDMQEQFSGQNANSAVGGTVPSFATTNETSLLEVVRWLAIGINVDHTVVDGDFKGDVDPDQGGNQERTFTDAQTGGNGSVTLPVTALEGGAAFSAEALEELRVAMRVVAAQKMTEADRLIVGPVTFSENQTWGTSASPEITVIDATAGEVAFTSKLVGAGTLIVKNGTLAFTTPSGGDQLAWRGDVILYSDEQPARFLWRGSNAKIGTADEAGNLALLGSTGPTGKVTLEIDTDNSYEVYGSMLTMSNDTEAPAEVIVTNGGFNIFGTFCGAGTSLNMLVGPAANLFHVKGTFTAACPSDAEPEDLNLSFAFLGKMNIRYDSTHIAAAILSLRNYVETYGAPALPASTKTVYTLSSMCQMPAQWTLDELEAVLQKVQADGYDPATADLGFNTVATFTQETWQELVDGVHGH